MNFVGLDVSFNTGLIILSEQSTVLNEKLISCPSSECIESRILFITDKILKEMQDYTPFSIALEGLSFASSGRSTLDLAGLNFYVRLKFYTSSFNYIIVPPNTLKKFITGSGKCKKNLMLLKVYKKFGVEFSDDNLCDAYALAKYCEKLYRDKL